MSWISGRIQQLQRESRKRRIAAWMPQLQEAQRHLYAARAGGAVDPFRSLLRAERIVDGLASRPSSGSRGGEGRLLLRSQALTLVLDPLNGGRLLELSDKQAERNLIETAWTERLLAPGAAVREFARGRAPELSDLSRGTYAARLREEKGAVLAELGRKVKLGRGKAAQELIVEKSVKLPARGRRVIFSHRLENRSGRQVNFLFVTSSTFTLKDAHVNRTGEAPGVRRFAVLDPAARLQVGWTFARAARLWYFPLETGSGESRAYRGVTLAGAWPVRLPPRGAWRISWELNIEEPSGWQRQ